MNGNKNIELYSTFGWKSYEEQNKIIRQWGRRNKKKFWEVWEIADDFTKHGGERETNSEEAEKLFTSGGFFAQLARRFPCIAIKNFSWNEYVVEYATFTSVKTLCKEFMRNFQAVAIYFDPVDNRLLFEGLENSGEFVWTVFPLTKEGQKRLERGWNKYLNREEVLAGIREFEYQGETGQLI